LPDASFTRLGWQAVNKLPGKFSNKDRIEGTSPDDEKKQFLNVLQTALQNSGGQHFCIFAHGAADPFEDSAFDAAELAYYMKCPMIIYSWPSLGKLRRYRVDEGNIEWSQEHFNTFCRDLQHFAKEQSCHATLVAHSMGNRLVARAVPIMSNAALLTDVALVSPDIDAETFKHYVMDYHSRGVKVRLYVSNKDKVLPFTQMLYGGYYRLGEGVGSMLSMISAPQQILNQAVNSLSGKNKTGSDVSADIFPNLEKIDFTAIDPGFIGHHFPFSLVSSMSLYDNPGPGLELTHSQEGKGNLFSRFSRWCYELGPIDARTTAACQRVVRTPGNKK
jgi:hypothetical protein